MGRVFGYIRVAYRPRQSLQQEAVRQAALLDRICLALGRQMSSLFLDVGVSSKTPFLERPQGGRLAGIVKSGDIVLVSRLSRLSRRLPGLLTLESWFQERGVGLVTSSGTWVQEARRKEQSQATADSSPWWLSPWSPPSPQVRRPWTSAESTTEVLSK